MSCTVDMALDTGEERTAATLHVALSGTDVFLLFEVESADTPQQQLLPVALSAVVGSLSVPVGSSPERNLETALQAANRAVHEARLRNPAAGECLVSALVVSRREGRIATAGAGANAAYLRTPGELRPLFSPETVSAKLMLDGITSELTDETGGDGSTPTNGLGVAPEMFEVKQTMTVEEPGRCEVVLCGAALAAEVGTAHMESMPVVTPVHDTARRLYRIFWSKKGRGSGVLAAQCRPGADGPLADVPDFERPASTNPRVWLWLAAIAIAALAAAYFLHFAGQNKKRVGKGNIPPATSLLPTKPIDSMPRPVAASLKDVVGAPETVAGPGDVVLPHDVAAAPDAVPTGDLNPRRPDTRALEAAKAKEEERAKERARRKKKKKRRKPKRKKAKTEESEKNKEEQPPSGGPAVVTDPDFPDVTIQVMDFSRPEDVKEQGSDTNSGSPKFPMAKEFPDVRSGGEPDVVSQPEVGNEPGAAIDVMAAEVLAPPSEGGASEVLSVAADVSGAPLPAEPAAKEPEIVAGEEL